MGKISQSKFAKSIGVAQPYIASLIRDGKLPGGKDGVDPEHPEVKAFVERKRQREAEAKAASVSSPDGIRNIPKTELEKLKIAQQIKQIDLAMAIKRGEYIHRDIVQRFFSKLYSIESTEIMRIGDRLCPSLCALAGVKDGKVSTKMNAAIEKELYRAMETIKKHFAVYLDKNQEAG